MGLLTCLLISILSIPFSHLLIFLVRAALHLAMPLLQLHARAHFTWRPGSQFLGGGGGGGGGHHRAPTSGHMSATSMDDDPLLLPSDIKLSIARYCRSSTSSMGMREAASVECVFCLCGIEEGEEIRVLRCKHLFHRRCLDRWLLRRRAMCPLCRDALVPREPAATKQSYSGVVDDEYAEEELEESAMAWINAYVQYWWMW